MNLTSASLGMRMVLEEDPSQMSKVTGGCGSALLYDFTISAQNLLFVVAEVQKEANVLSVI